MDGEWDVVISYLQDVFNNNEELSFDELKNANKGKLQDLKEPALSKILEDVTNHKANIDKSRRVLEDMLVNISAVIAAENKKKAAEPKQKKGRSYWTSQFNISDSITVNSEVAFKLRQKGADDEWIQCEVTKIIGDGTKYVIQKKI